MRYRVELERRADGRVLARCPDLGVDAEAPTRDEALRSLREAARYALEVCPCDTTADALELDVVDWPGARA